MKSKQTNDAGFTILELLAVLVVISIMMFASMSVLSETGPERELRAATNEISAMVRWARMIASQRNRAYEVVINNNTITLNESSDTTCLRASFNTGKPGVRSFSITSKFPSTSIAITAPTSLVGTGDHTLCIKPNGEVYRTNTSNPVSVAYGATVEDKLIGNHVVYTITTIKEQSGGNTEIMSNDLSITYYGRVRIEVAQ